MQINKRYVNKVIMALVFIVGIIFTLYLCLMSDGTLTDDEIGHLLIANRAWKFPKLLLDLWGRPVNTLLYFIPSQFGLLISRLYTIGLTIAIAFLTMKTAQQLKVKYLFLTAAFLWFQPWFTELGYFAITEIPFSLFLILGMLFATLNKDVWASLVFGCLMYIRHEGIALTGLWAVLLIYRRNWRCLAITVMPAIMFNFLYFLVNHDQAIAMFGDVKPTDFYGQGGWLHFGRSLVNNTDPIILIFALIGLFTSIYVSERLLLVILYPTYLIMHVVIFRYGLFASGGYGFFLLPLAPGIAIFASLGLERSLRLFHQVFKSENSIAQVTGKVTIFLILVVVVSYGFNGRPFYSDVTSKAALEASDWLKRQPYKNNKVVSTSVWFHYLYELPWENGKDWTAINDLNKMEVGSIAVWDDKYSERWGINKTTLDNYHYGWVKLNSFQDEFIQIYQKQK